ncbi:hypothetical protein ACFQ21_02685 [Ohtaekwangia kribbensis]|uniref:Lipoprotein n=1 Tax=Ohtaekwangia kribbensis TaxID=688913 RepID=A0ABW3JWI7_9BACT
MKKENGIAFLLLILSFCVTPSKNDKSNERTIALYAVAPEAVAMDTEDKNYKYIQGYKIDVEYVLTLENKKLLIDTIESDSIYSKDSNSKRCPHYAQYAINYGGDSFVISVAPCSKILVFKKDSVSEPQLIDLINNNKLERVIANISSSATK